MTDRERLTYIIESEGLTSKQFCERVGIGTGTISNITSGRNKASLDVLQRVRARFPKYNPIWLYEGIGEPLGESTPTDPILQQELPLIETAPEVPEEDEPDSPVSPVSPVLPDSPVLPEAPVAARQIERIVIFYTDGTYEER